MRPVLCLSKDTPKSMKYRAERPPLFFVFLCVSRAKRGISFWYLTDSSAGVYDSGAGIYDSAVRIIDSGAGIYDSSAGIIDSGAGICDSGAGVIDSGAGITDSGAFKGRMIGS